MSFLNPVSEQVSVYMSTDADAPVLNKTANNLAVLFKACLVTGYGTKVGAGWTMPFEDMATGVKVFKPDAIADIPYFLRLSADTGTSSVAQVYLDMTAASVGTLKMQLATAFKYATGAISGKWILIASKTSVWFMCEQANAGVSIDRAGAYFYCGSVRTSDAAESAIYMQHTGGSGDNGNYSPPTGIYTTANGYLKGQLMLSDYTVTSTDFRGQYSGDGSLTNTNNVSPFWSIVNGEMYYLPNLFLPLNQDVHSNFATVTISDGCSAIECVSVGMSGWGNIMFYIPTQKWVV